MAGFDDGDYERDYPRENLRTKAEIRVDEHWHDCTISNISASGARLNVVLSAGRGKDVVIKIGEFGEFNATVAWCSGKEIGVKFDHDPLEMNQVMIGLAS